jgi:hypothetical protein
MIDPPEDNVRVILTLAKHMPNGECHEKDNNIRIVSELFDAVGNGGPKLFLSLDQQK